MVSALSCVLGGARPWDGPHYEGFGVLISLMGDVVLFCSLGSNQEGAAGLEPGQGDSQQQGVGSKTRFLPHSSGSRDPLWARDVS